MATEEMLRSGMEFGFINNQAETLGTYQPHLITNQGGETVLDYLLEELQTLQPENTFTFAIAFVTESGLITLKSTLADLAAKGVKGRLITSTYLNFNQPKAFEELLKIPNLDVRILNEDGFHTKAYYFDRGNYQSLIVGSANLTQNALKKNFEWNLRVTSATQGDITKQMSERLEELWDRSEALTPALIDAYAENYIAERPVFRPKVKGNPSDLIVPNDMQKPALAELKQLMAQNEHRALVVAATGTGKTFLSAFAVQQAKPKTTLFVVHREQIAKKAAESFRKVLGGPESDYGVLSGSRKETAAKYLFATINTVSNPAIMEELGADRFEYIVVDEAHRVGFSNDENDTMYERFMNFYEPKFMLGMTATPDRTDGVNVYEYFDYNLAYEISLLDALDAELLAPFHYIGVTEYEQMDGTVVSDNADLQHLVSDERVEHLLEKTDYYGYSGDELKGLIFVSQVDEGQKLADELNKRDVPTQFISGADPIKAREAAVAKLEAGELMYLITVDIFNEGVDIPAVNQVVMMRPTQSSIIFLQQLGRGLRKTAQKEYVTIIDFIGNYSNSYMIPMAFNQGRSSDKEEIQKQVIAPEISGVSTIHFEEVARERIVSSIRDAKLDSAKRFKEVYQNVQNKVGDRLPMLLDFEKFGGLGMADIIAKYNFLPKYQEKFEKKVALPVFNEAEEKFLDYLSREVATTKRMLEFVVLEMVMQGQVTDQDLLDEFKRKSYFHTELSLDQLERIFDKTYVMDKTRVKYGDDPILVRNNGSWSVGTEFAKALANPTFKQYVEDLVQAGMLAIVKRFDIFNRFEVGRKYTRGQVIKQFDWMNEQNPQNVGGYIERKDKAIVPIFVTLDKTEEHYKNQVAYEDEVTSRDTMIWYSTTSRYLKPDSLETRIAETDEYGYGHMFMKRSDDVTKDGLQFFYLGAIKALSAEEVTVVDKDGKNQNLVRFELKFEKSLPMDLYHALVGEITK